MSNSRKVLMKVTVRGTDFWIRCHVVSKTRIVSFSGINILKITDIQLNRKRKIGDNNDCNEKKSRIDGSVQVSDLWVDRYRPQSTKQIIGQQGDKSSVNKLLKWLSNWHINLDKKPGFGKFGSDDGQGFRAALLSGPPGVGKTTTAYLVCKELGFDFVELNASDARNKKSLDQIVRELLKNTTLSSYFSGQSCVTSKHVVIMDEVDGMAGNEDRGGVAELIQLIKTTKVPLICICNDRSHPKMRSLVNYCFDLRFFRPRVEQIKGPMMSIAYKEGLKIAPNILHELIMSSNQDIRQVLHNLSLLGTGGQRIENLQSNQSIKDVKLSTFDAVRKVFTAGEEYARMSFEDKSHLFFGDYSIMPLFIFENYCSVNPSKAKSEAQKLKLAMKSIESMAFGDIIEKQIRSVNNWSLLPLEAAFASVMPGAYMNGQINSMIGFPSFMGKLSTTNKRNRLLQELKMHMNLKISGSKTALNLDYLEPLRDAIIEPLASNGTGGVPTSIEKLENYCLRREDIESIIELTVWNNQKDPMSRVDSKVKAALTRAYNKEGFCLPYSLGTVTKGKKGKAGPDLDGFGDGEDGDEEEATGEDTEDNDDITSDAMIKAKKKTTKKVAENETKTKSKANKSKKSETKKEDKKKTKKKIIIESDSEAEEIPKKVVKKETKNVKPVESEVSPQKSNKKETKTESKSDKTNGKKESAKTLTKNETKVELKSVKEEIKSETKKNGKKEPKSSSKSDDSVEKKTKTKSEPKSETKAKKTPENSKTQSKNNSNSGSKGKQLTLNSFFTRK